ncbi:interleukin-25 isoform X2 [Trachypithecus francoisi]|uniref:interleukin-25 isoform X2 n=1 Tax=Trachypithecus francoisi TaxID=54180 RepID=UPI00141A89CC|nr:interleukin-25 isoform X2 [Trachypithecus francoisi]
MRGRLARQEEERGGPGRRCGTASKGARCVLSPRPPGRHHLVQSPGAARPRPRGRPGLAGAESSLRGPGQSACFHEACQPVLHLTECAVPSMYQVVAFLAMVMGTHTYSHWPSCCPSKGQDSSEELLRWNTVPVPPLKLASTNHHAVSCRTSEDGPLNSRAISPWRYELDRDLNRLPQDLYHARCLCPHCVSLQTGSHMDPRGNSELLYHNQTVFYRRPCHGEKGTHKGYCLQRRLYLVSLACVCVRPRVMG